jgi:hypothetical protein
MNLVQLLETKKEEILATATDALNRSPCRHYHQAGFEECKKRLRDLLELAENSVRERNLIPLIDHVEKISRERYDAGFDLQEVQIAFHVLEESIWNLIFKEVPAAEQAQAFGLISTVLGAGKDALARKYVSLVSHKSAPSFDLHALFKGTDSVVDQNNH